MSNKKEKRRDLRLMWNSNGVWTNSGYGVFSRDLLYRLLDDGWPVAHIAFYGLQSYPITLDGLKVYPNMTHMYGADAMVHHSRHFKADVTFGMQDVPTLDPNHIKNIKNWIPYVPIDQEPVPPLVINALKYAYKIITFSKFGQKALEKRGFYSKLIVEGTDTNIFKPLKKSKQQIKKELGLPVDSFLFGMVSANKENPPRKGYQEVLEAFAKFKKSHPKAAILFHTQQVAPQGFPIKDFANHLGVEKSVFFVNQYDATYQMGSKEVNNEINAMDVYLCPSQTEGFGLTIIEAQSAGVPVIVNNCMSMPELLIPGKTGEICEHQAGKFSSQRGYWYPADVNSLHSKMEKLYKRLQGGQKDISKAARKFVVDNYNIDTIVKEQWIPLLEDIQKELVPKDLTKKSKGDKV